MSLETRAVPMDAPTGSKLVGTAIPYGRWSEPIGGQFRERIERGAFGDLSGADIKLLYMHDQAEVLARTKSGTLRLKDSAGGLRFEADLADTSRGRDVRELLARGDLTGEMSFGFYVERDEWNAKRTERTVKAARLVEVSVVTDAAYGDRTNSSLRDVSAAALEAARLRLELHKARVTRWLTS